MTATVTSASAALEQVLGQQAWAVVRLRDSPTVTVLGGALVPTEKLADIPAPEGAPFEGVGLSVTHPVREGAPHLHAEPASAGLGAPRSGASAPSRTTRLETHVSRAPARQNRAGTPGARKQ